MPWFANHLILLPKTLCFYLMSISNTGKGGDMEVKLKVFPSGQFSYGYMEKVMLLDRLRDQVLYQG